MSEHNRIYDLGLHQSLKTTGNGIDIEITRVPGGWIYNFLTLKKDSEKKDSEKKDSEKKQWETNLIFVPYHGEFEQMGSSSPSPTPSSEE
jgi:hypothetical protein